MTLTDLLFRTPLNRENAGRATHSSSQEPCLAESPDQLLTDPSWDYRLTEEQQETTPSRRDDGWLI